MEIHFDTRLRMVYQVRVVTAMPAVPGVHARALRLPPDRHDDSRSARCRQPGRYAFEQRAIHSLAALDRIATERHHKGVRRKRDEQE